MSEFKLAEAIISMSESDVWDTAKLEWKLHHIYFSDEPEVCICGHQKIIECCIILNHINGNDALVGNVCVKRFLGIDSVKIFQAVKRVKKEVTKALNAETIEYARDKRWISLWEYEYYLDTLRRRVLSKKQMEIRIRINKKIIGNVLE